MQADPQRKDPRRRSYGPNETPAFTLESISTAASRAEPTTLTSSSSRIVNLLGRSKSKPQLDNEAMHTEAIHDIDSNLIFGNGEYNPGLGEAFSAKSIPRNVFCSDMGKFFEGDIKARCDVRDHYKKTYEFDTYAIITPPDYAWHIDPPILAEFFKECFKERINLRPGQAQKEDLDKIDTILDSNPRFENLKLLVKPDKSAQEIEQILKVQVPPGTAFKQLEESYSSELADKATNAKWVIDIAASKAKLTGVKGLLLRKFFKDNEKRFCSFVVTDDKQHEIDAILAESKRWHNAIVTGIWTPEKAQECTKEYYTEKLGSESSSLSSSGSITPPTSFLKKQFNSLGNSSDHSSVQPFPGVRLRNSSSGSK